MPSRTIAILIFDDVEVLDFCGPFEVFSVANNFTDPAAFSVFPVAEKAGCLGLQCDATRLFDRVDTGVAVVHEQRPDIYGIRLQTEFRQSVKEFLDRADVNLLAAQIGGWQVVHDVAVRDIDPKSLGLETRLINEEPVWAEVEGWLSPLIESGLEQQKADNRFPLAGVQFDDEVTLGAAIRVPLGQDVLLCWPERAGVT